MTLCPAGRRFGAAWGPDDTIVFASSAAPGLMRVPAAGGEPRPLTEPGPDEGAHLWPTFVPGGNAVLYTTGRGPNASDEQVGVLSLETGEQHLLVQGVAGTVTASGHLVFAREASLWAVAFDADRLTVSGEPAPMVEGVQVNLLGNWAHYALAADGTLVYLPAEGGAVQRSLVWVDRAGQETPLGTPPRPYRYPRISPDGTRVSVTLQDQQQDTWIWDLAGETLTRLTLDPGEDQFGEWVPPDGHRVIFASSREGPANLFWRAADGTGAAERLIESERPQYPQVVAPDGSVLVVGEGGSVGNDLLLVPLSGDPVAEELLVTEFRERNAAISPDGNWFAYQSDASGRWEVYVRPFPDADAGRVLISTNGGTRPAWAPDGSELFYVNTNQLFAVPVETDPTFSRGTPTLLIDGDYRLDLVASGRMYDVHPNGDRFLMVKSLGAASGPSAASLNVVLNWFEELKARVPVN